VTLLRAVGWLSRPDLGLRPAHAGPPIETPGAQVPGRNRQELSLRLHAAGEPERALRAHAFARPPVAFPGGAPAGAPLGDGSRLVEVDDPQVLVSAIEPRADGQSVLRIWNASGAQRTARIAWKPAGASALEAVDLADRPVPAGAQAEGPSVNAGLRPWQIASYRVR
jgi:alpha-mannosidase/mannosylglycerate hydrolase